MRCPTSRRWSISIGGGGLIAGNAIAARGMRPDMEVVGVEAALYPSMRNAITGANDPIGGPTLAEGIAVKNVGKLTLPVVRELVSDIILVDEAHIERAVNAYLTLQKTMAEGAGAAGLAAMLASPSASAAAASASSCAAATSIRASSPRSWCASSSASTASCRSASPSPTGPACSGRSRRRRQARRQYPRGRPPPAVSRRAGQGAKLDITVETRDRADSEDILRAL